VTSVPTLSKLLIANIAVRFAFAPLVIGYLATAAMPSAAAEPDIQTTTEFLAAYDKGTPIARKAYEMSVGSTEQGLLYANAYLVSRHQDALYCQPTKLTMTEGQLINMVRDGIKELPALGEAPIFLSVLQVLVMTFPCPQNR
jgi:hypothetical protein